MNSIFMSETVRNTSSVDALEVFRSGHPRQCDLYLATDIEWKSRLSLLSESRKVLWSMDHDCRAVEQKVDLYFRAAAGKRHRVT